MGGELRKQRPHTYESPRKSWNLIRPAVVSASKLGNTSPSRSPGMVGPSLQLRQREVEERSQLGTEEEETTWTNPELGGAREVTPAYSPIRDKVWNAGPVVICTGVFQIIMITYEIFPICNYPPSDNGSSSIYSIANGNIDLQKVLWSGSQKNVQTLAETIRQSELNCQDKV